MRFASTRRQDLRVGLSEALAQGLSPEGGLFVPSEWPALTVPPAAAEQAVQTGANAPAALASLAATVIAPFVDGDALAPALPTICREAFDFPAPLVPLGDAQGVQVLELFHGPTAAFKDFGARFLAACLARVPRAGLLRILVATSGDTGGAVAAAFHERPGVEVDVLFPKGLVSPTQERQLTCWGGNVRSFAVRGRFDDCQRLVKQAFADPALRARGLLSSANSINLGRLLPQMVYYWAASLALVARHGQPASFVIPSGNLGNATACVWARRCGAPIRSIVLAHNANRTVPDYLTSGVLQPRDSVATLSSAMDVGNPSNLERLRDLFGSPEALRGAVSALSVDDEATRERIRADYSHYGRIWCPHSAVAAEAFARLTPPQRATGPWVLVATAHPAKFREIIEPLIDRPVPMPESLARLFGRPTHRIEIDATLAALEREL